jgi:hypothetical protein
MSIHAHFGHEENVKMNIESCDGFTQWVRRAEASWKKAFWGSFCSVGLVKKGAFHSRCRRDRGIRHSKAEESAILIDQEFRRIQDSFSDFVGLHLAKRRPRTPALFCKEGRKNRKSKVYFQRQKARKCRPPPWAVVVPKYG